MLNAIIDFQYKFSQLYNSGINRKKFECRLSPNQLYAMNTSKNTFIALLFTLFSCGLLFSGIVESTNKRNEITVGFVLVFFVMHFIAGLVGLRQFLWLLNGRQEMTIENGLIILEKKGTFLVKSKTYEFDKAQNFREFNDQENLSVLEKTRLNIDLTRKVLFGHILGQIQFDYDGKKIKVFSDLNKVERIKLLSAIASLKQNNI